MIDYLLRPVRFDYLRAFSRSEGLNVLDIGCGNHLAILTKKYFRGCTYHGLDITYNYNNDVSDFIVMDRFFQIDLNHSDLMEIPNEFYDCIIFSHVMEHLSDGGRVLKNLISKLKPGGVIYIETPAPKSQELPRMKGTLNFWDDPTHTRIYPLSEITDVCINNSCGVLRCGSRRSWKRIFLFPFHCFYSIWKYKYLSGTVFWDITGFANIVIARKSN